MKELKYKEIEYIKNIDYIKYSIVGLNINTDENNEITMYIRMVDNITNGTVWLLAPYSKEMAVEILDHIKTTTQSV